MIRVLEIAAMGHEPVAWSVPNIGNRRLSNGTKGHRFTTRGRKTDKSTGRLSLKDWQETIRKAAKGIMSGRDKETSPLYVHFEFIGKTPAGYRHGELWDVRLVWVEKTKKWSKKNRDEYKGQSEPDLTNLQKAAEDALNGLVWADDCKNRFISSIAFLGPVPGVKIYINRIEAGDYPGHGDPVP